MTELLLNDNEVIDLCKKITQIDKKAIYDLCDSYLNKGIKDIAILQDHRNDVVSSQMYHGAQDAFKKHNLAYMPFVGEIVDRPSVLKGSIESMVEEAQKLI